MKFLDFSKINSAKDLPVENRHIEYKKSSWKLPDSFWETVGSFANTDGGIIILGIDEPKKRQYKIIGVDSPDDIKTQILNNNSNREIISRDIINDDDIETIVYKNKCLIQVIIHPEQYNSRPIIVKNVAYTRTDDGDRHATEDQLKYFAVEHQGQIDTRLLPHYQFSDLNRKDIKLYRDQLIDKTNELDLSNRSLEDFAKDLGVLRKDRATNSDEYELTEGGLLFFGNYISITDRFPRFQIDYFRY